jgi:3-isopropylmalate/(R)-2-methylmalate dehydratase small subunit
MDGVEREANSVLTVDLEAQTITGPDGSSISFDIDSFHKQCLLEGHDDIALTLKKKDKIADFEEQQKQEQPWQWIGQA